MARGNGEAPKKCATRRPRARQLELAFPSRWGGARAGAGRKRGPRGMVWHRPRPLHRPSEPVHVTMRARVAPLRSQQLFPTVRLAVQRAAQRDPARFRVLQFSAQRDHLHLIVEAADKRALSSGLQGLAIRVARYVNDLLGRRGALWADRWHGRALKTPREVRNALAYVLANFKKHEQGATSVASERPPSATCGIDPYSSGAWFDGWLEWKPWSGTPPPFAERCAWARHDSTENAQPPPRVTAEPQTWLAAVGWRRHGLVRLSERPRTHRSAHSIAGSRKSPISLSRLARVTRASRASNRC